jgi:plasmid stabilization system protein ParE
MKYRLVISPSALQDELDAYNYYENIAVGLGERLLDSIEKRCATLAENPEFYGFCDESKIIRDVAIDGFPYLIIYEIAGNDVVIYAIHNTHSKPRK